MDRDAADNVRLLYNKFKPVFKAWSTNQLSNTSLSSVPSTMLECLYEDIYNMGLIMSTADSTGQPTEIRLTAELLVLIESLENNSFEGISSYNEDIKEEKEEKIIKELYEQIKLNQNVTPTLPHSIAISKEFDKRNNTKVSVEIIEIFNKILDNFIIRDGVLSSEELNFIKVYENLWKDSDI